MKRSWPLPPHLHRQRNGQLSQRFSLVLSLPTENTAWWSLPTELIPTDGCWGLPKNRTPDGLVFLNDKQELSSPLLYLCPLKADPWQLHFCRPSRKQNSTIIEGWHPPFVINMQRYATHNSNWKCHTGTALPCWGAIFAGLKGYNQPLLPRGICKTGMFGTTPLNSSSLVNSLPEEPQGLAEAATCLTEHKCR